ncbi:PqqD family protein [Telluribacter sp.]|jgi:hypothetical protein|uniref:PqqD family protein n=1 Tax=Telluribacter sp. TaxID=1978767 RepID=UPI002E100FA7|nr:PqqD family protein [Telluribacter sp.]
MSSQTYKLAGAGVASEHFEEEVILINLPRGNYYSLRFTGFELWNQLLKGANVTQLAVFLSGRYGLDEASALQDTQQFIDQLLTEGLVVPAESAPEAAPEETVPAGVPYSVPALEVYSDMQDLLLLDPVHDVDSEQGWPIKK